MATTSDGGFTGSQQRTFDDGDETIENIVRELGLPRDVAETARTILRRAWEEELHIGRNRHSVAAASAYLAARHHGCSQTPSAVADVADRDVTEVTRAARYVTKELGLAVAPPEPEHHLDEFADRLDLRDETVERAGELVVAGREEGVTSGCSPTAIAAGALYAASLLCNESRTQHDVAEACDVSHVSIRNRYTDLIEAAEQAQRYQTQSAESDAYEQR